MNNEHNIYRFNREQAPQGGKELLPGGEHTVLGASLLPPFASEYEVVLLGMGCFWGAERRLWQQPGVAVTAVGYAGGETAYPSYQQVCTGLTGHTEVVLVVFDPLKTTLQQLLAIFWESHDPTQGLRQGNDTGSQYRSAIYTSKESQQPVIEQSYQQYQQKLTGSGFGTVTTEVRMGVPFYYAEDYHQQYLDKNPAGYCGLKGTGVSCS
ncbi:peptide-methionine (S)-S-oxide reductase [Sinobacterium caligoides]|uniref:Peptide methionine sulfoxide reductase MsrA n=1 Tax=Sinobacterium caligoides TaxID=933926 RepID=A0A3N2DZM0_9GAMM|nr:peptide-methionine (S)-S-oxide reductase MsrA [Sinobacterium caligoides]ROS05290.1 peptide-methionine (S)-S-oxide reductase [Sinobacterium caligoides]